MEADEFIDKLMFSRSPVPPPFYKTTGREKPAKYEEKNIGANLEYDVKYDLVFPRPRSCDFLKARKYEKPKPFDYRPVRKTIICNTRVVL